MSEGAGTAPRTETPASAPSGDGMTWLDRAPGWAVPLAFALIIGGAVVAANVSHDFYPNVVWRYYWGPIVSDAWDCNQLGHLDYQWAVAHNSTDCGHFAIGHEGVMAHSGYNSVNTASWAILLGLCLFGTAQILRRTKTPMDGKLILGASGWVIAGSVFHVMEDAHLFAPPVQYFFITPIIYLLFAAMGILSLGIGVYLKTIAEKASVRVALDKLLVLLAIPVLGYFYLWMTGERHVAHYVHPIWVALAMVAAYIPTALRFRSIGRIVPGELVGFMSIGWILLSVAYVVSYLQAPWWVKPGGDGPVRIALIAPLLAFATACLVWFIGVRLLARAENQGRASRRDGLLGLVQPIGWLIVFAQTLDGFATSLGIDIGGYHEKHVLSAKVINATCNFSGAVARGNPADGYRCIPTGHDWFWLGAHYPTFVGFATLKLALAVLVASVLFNPRSTAKQNATITGLIAFAIVMVGLGPGVRDFVRMGLGI